MGARIGGECCATKILWHDFLWRSQWGWHRVPRSARVVPATPADLQLNLNAGLQGDEMAPRRIEQLAAKCDAGALTPEERAEYQLFVAVGDLVALLQAKARRDLTEHPTA